jgi:predicted ArsR family transcriptional regulator
MEPDDAGLAALSGLEDQVRRRLYQFVASRGEPVGRDEAAAAVGIGRPLAAYHLDKLVELGLLDASFQRPAGRRGPGAGRPAKFYARSEQEFTVTVPPRDYELAARLLAAAVESDSSGAGRAALRQVAWKFGAEAGHRARDSGGRDGDAGGRGRGTGTGPDAGRAAVAGALGAYGYEPWRGDDDVIRLRNCPFHQLAAQHRDVVCGMNLALIDGLVTGLSVSGLRPVLDPHPGYCCVAIGAAGPGTVTGLPAESDEH